MKEVHKNRIRRLQNALEKDGINQFLLTDTTSIDYLTGHRFSPGERFLGLLADINAKPKLFLNRLFPCEMEELFDIVELEDGDDIVAKLAVHCQGKLAVDDHLPAYVLLPLLQRMPDILLGSSYISGLRLIKDEDEKAKMRAASLLNDQVMKEVEASLRIGITDHEVEDLIHSIHKRLGVKASFDPIVAFKQVASDPHGSANGQILQKNDCVVIDMGLVLDNYCSDMTRTFLFGDSQMEDIYDIVKRANETAIAAVKPGVRFCDVDRAARFVIEEAGYGPYFTHRTGHGIGMDVHEPMDVSKVNEAVLRPGMCFSIEPGIYLPGKGGVRIEDLVLVTEDGAEVLNHYPK